MRFFDGIVPVFRKAEADLQVNPFANMGIVNDFDARFQG